MFLFKTVASISVQNRIVTLPPVNWLTIRVSLSVVCSKKKVIDKLQHV